MMIMITMTVRRGRLRPARGGRVYRVDAPLVHVEPTAATVHRAAPRRGRDRSLRRQEHVLSLFVVVIYKSAFVIRGRRRLSPPVVLPTVVHVVARVCVRVRERG
jgi:hypothetical protein